MNKYWQSLDEYRGLPDKNSERFEKEDKNQILDMLDDENTGIRSSRRDFLKVFGFSLTSAALAASCERPVQKAIPYLIHPEEIVPGQSLHYASFHYDGRDFSHIIVKTRDGRPIKIEGNPLSPYNGQGTTARVQASVLSLYNNSRLKEPSLNKVQKEWAEIDAWVSGKLVESEKNGKQVVLLSCPVVSPSTRALIEEFGKNYSRFKWIEYNEQSYSAILEANELCYGKNVVPAYSVARADLVVSFNADFLGSWMDPGRMIREYASRRKPREGNSGMLKHIQFESVLSLTGSNADRRIQIRPSEETLILANLYNELAERDGKQKIACDSSPYDLKETAALLNYSKGKSLVVCGSNDLQSQIIVCAINGLLGNVGSTVDLSSPFRTAGGNDKEMSAFIGAMNSGDVGAVLMWGVNPAYDHPERGLFITGVKKVPCSVAFFSLPNETTVLSGCVAPVPHFLESWDDAEILPGVLSLSQPCIHPMFNTRSVQDSLLTWSGIQGGYHQYLMDRWKSNYFEGKVDFETFWKQCLRNGIFVNQKKEKGTYTFNDAALKDLNIRTKRSPGTELVLYESVALGGGRGANNPWLLELPDPVTKVSWENVLLVNPEDASEGGLINGDIVKITEMFEVPVLLQVGQAKGTCGLALGYGHTEGAPAELNCGVNAFLLMDMKDGRRSGFKEGFTFQKTGKNRPLALSQTHNSMEGRPIVRETSLEEYMQKPDAGNELHEEYESHHKTLYPEVDFDGFHWGLAVDLTACVGCNSCVIGCQAENNIPVVGKDEVYRRRIMHWIRIDRYYTGEPSDPGVSFQPLMCQHCDNAPCENVCPVSATNHSSEGLNQMSYNRCIGTKYCINNCPYRVRRFNWYQYTGNKKFDLNTSNDLGKMVLNPDVTVRDRGVVEKCSFCAQRIQEVKLKAKLENRIIADGEIQPACVQACPAEAMVFGNLKDKNSMVSRKFSDPGNYHLLEQLHTLPSVGYLTKIRNANKEEQV